MFWWSWSAVTAGVGCWASRVRGAASVHATHSDRTEDFKVSDTRILPRDGLGMISWLSLSKAIYFSDMVLHQ